MADTYTFELTFTGLCIFTFEGDKRNPKSVNALLVNATGVGNGHHGAQGGANGGVHVHSEEDAHLPRLTFETRNLVGFPDPPHQLLPGVGGTPLGTIDMSQRFVAVVPQVQPFPPIKTSWRPEGTELPQEPANLNDERWLDWTMALQRMNGETPDPSVEMPHAGLRKDKLIAAVHIPCGNLEARTFMKAWGQDGWRYVRWNFRPPGDNGASGTAFAMAETVVLSIPELPKTKEVRIANGDGSFDLRLKPARRSDGSLEDLVRASITNLPTKAVPTQELPEYLGHFDYFYQAVDFPAGAPAHLRLPHPKLSAIIHTVTRDNSYCPPTSHTRAD